MSVIDELKKMFTFPKPRKNKIPALLLLNAEKRSGISQIRTLQNVLSRENEIYESEFHDRKMIEIIIEEVYKDILENGVIEIVVPPNTIVNGTGTDATGKPIAFTGTILKEQSGVGVLR